MATLHYLLLFNLIYLYIQIKQPQFHQYIMARITVEDCIKQVKNQYDLVILAKERAVQLGRGAAPAVDPEDDKKPVIALREIGECKITPSELEESIIAKLRQIPDYQEEEEELDEVDNDSFRQMYQGGLSKSEMEKSATRKFTSRSPRIETRPIQKLEQFDSKTAIKTVIESADSVEENRVNTSDEVEADISEQNTEDPKVEVPSGVSFSASEFDEEILEDNNTPIENSEKDTNLSEIASEDQISEEVAIEEK